MMEYKPFEPFKALNPGELVKTQRMGPIYEVVHLCELYFFGENKPGWEWDIVYKTVVVRNDNNTTMRVVEDNVVIEIGHVAYWTSRLLWTLSDWEEQRKWTTEDWDVWQTGDTSYMSVKYK